MSLWNALLAYHGFFGFSSFSRRKQRTFSLWQTNHLWRWHERASDCLVAWTYSCRRGELSAFNNSHQSWVNWNEQKGSCWIQGALDLTLMCQSSHLPKWGAECYPSRTMPFLFISTNLHLECLWSALLWIPHSLVVLSSWSKPFALLDHSVLAGYIAEQGEV